MTQRNENKEQVFNQTRKFHKAVNDFIMEHRLEYCPLAVVAALNMLLYDLTQALTQPEQEKLLYMCRELYPELALAVTTSSFPESDS